jgi:hypothetical protein
MLQTPLPIPLLVRDAGIGTGDRIPGNGLATEPVEEVFSEAFQGLP